MENSVSVVIPAFNRAGTIVRCLDSVCGQTLPPAEVIVVDDCSTDGTVATVNDYARAHSIVRCVVQERNAGAQAARNRGIKEARGTWIAFQDSDDEWIPDKLEKQMAVLEKNGFDAFAVVHTDCFRHEQAVGTRNTRHLPNVNGEEVLQELLTAPGPMFQSMVVSKQALECIGMLDENVPAYQEWDTSILLARQCRFIHLHEPMFVYYLHEAGTMSANHDGDVRGYQYVVDKHRDEILQLCGQDVFDRHIRKNALRAMRWGLYADAERIMRKAASDSLHVWLLRLMARWRINVRMYDFAAKLARACGALVRSS